MDPVSVGAAALSVVGTILGIAGTSASTKAAKEQAKWNKWSNSVDARWNDYSAEQLRKAGALAEWQQRLDTQRTQGTTRLALSGNGVDVNEGTAARIQVDNAAFGELDALLLREQFEQKATAAEFQANISRRRSKYESARTDAISSAGIMTMLGQGAAGAVDVLQKWPKSNTPAVGSGYTAPYSGMTQKETEAVYLGGGW